MFTDTSRPNHLAHEVIDNSVDEAIEGYAKKHLTCKLFSDGSLEVEPMTAAACPSTCTPKENMSRGRADPHEAALRRQVLEQELPVLGRVCTV